MAQIFGCGKKSWIGSVVHFNVKIGVGRVCMVGVWSLYRLRDSTRDRKRITPPTFMFLFGVLCVLQPPRPPNTRSRATQTGDDEGPLTISLVELLPSPRELMPATPDPLEWHSVASVDAAATSVSDDDIWNLDSTSSISSSEAVVIIEQTCYCDICGDPIVGYPLFTVDERCCGVCWWIVRLQSSRQRWYIADEDQRSVATHLEQVWEHLNENFLP